MQPAVHGKGDLAASLAETCLSPGAGLTEKELTLVYDIVRILLGSVDVGIRRHLSGYLADRTDLPGDLDVIESLLYNKTAGIDPDTFNAIVHDFGELSALHIPLVHRRELSSAQAHHLSDRVSRSLRRH